MRTIMLLLLLTSLAGCYTAKRDYVNRLESDRELLQKSIIDAYKSGDQKMAEALSLQVKSIDSLILVVLQ